MAPCLIITLFQSTLPLRGATRDSLPPAPTRERFQSTLPLRGATIRAGKFEVPALFQSTLPLRGATYCLEPYARVITISIHAPLAGSDPSSLRNNHQISNFNPRSPCGERPWRHTFAKTFLLFQSTLPLRGATRSTRCNISTYWVFQSTLPLRGATKQKGEDLLDISNFNPRSPCGERRNAIQQRIYLIKISIHAPLAGSDILVHFLFPDSRISIHAPLAGSDGTFEADPTYSMDFNPRSPCGERPNSDEDEGRNGIFQSTLPLRGATTGTGYIPADVPISIHAPLAGSDHGVQGFKPCKTNFNPRSPCGERPSASLTARSLV